MKIDTLIQQLERLKRTHVTDVTFVWDDECDSDDGCRLVNKSPAGTAIIVLGGWGKNLRATYCNTPPKRFE